MMRRLIIASVLLAFGIGGSMAQDNSRNAKKTVVFNNLTYTKKEQKATVGSVLGTIATALATGQVTQQQGNYEDAVRASIIKGISQGRRIALSDGTGLSNANWYVDATINNISSTSKIEERKDAKGKAYNVTLYQATISATLHIKDAQTNQIVGSPTFNVSDTDCGWVTSAENALNYSLVYLANRITRYFNLNLPLYANIVEGARDKKDKQKEVYIDLGEGTKGVVKGLHFGVYTTKIVAGKEAKRLIGKIKITDVQGEEISLCKVQSGGKEIKAALDAGEPISITSLD